MNFAAFHWHFPEWLTPGRFLLAGKYVTNPEMVHILYNL
jgi:hypothetical protein